MITILQGKAEDRLAEIPDNSIQLTVTSPPFSNQRFYADGNDYDFATVAKGLYRVTCDGGIVAWNEGLTCRKNDELADPYEHVLAFKAAGFKLLQTIIVRKDGLPFPGRYRWANQTEFCWILLKGAKPRAFNKAELRDRPNRQSGKTKNAAQGRRGKDDALVKTGKTITISPLGYRSNCWDVPVGFNKSTPDHCAHEHCAVMSEHLADALIRAYSRPASPIRAKSEPADTVLDLFSGSGTTLKLACLNGRESIGIERSKKYVLLSAERLKPYAKSINISWLNKS